MDQESNNRCCSAKPARNKSNSRVEDFQNYRPNYYPDQEPAKASSSSQDLSLFGSVVSLGLLSDVTLVAVSLYQPRVQQFPRGGRATSTLGTPGLTLHHGRR